MNTNRPDPWAIILAGGDGLRLRSLTQKIAGDLRPKQFCALLDGETMFDRTRRRAELLVRPDRQVAVVTNEHREYFGALSSQLAAGCLVVQPSNQGTLAGIVYPVMRVEHLAGDVPIAILPSDHDVTDDRAFTTYVESAVDLVRALPDRVVVLGIEAETPETEYGWVEPSRLPLPVDGPPVFPVRRFWEKPSPTLARVLLERRCLWNSFVMVGWASAFIDCVRATVPEALVAFAPLRPGLGTPEEEAVAEMVYANLTPLSFSARVLARVPERLVTVRVKDVGWSDWGHPARVLATLRRTGRQPSWWRPTGWPRPPSHLIPHRWHGTLGPMGVILVVEDDTDTRQALGEYLTALFPDARVLMTESGENGLELAVRTRPSVVLLDLRLRGIQGFEFATRLRQHPVLAGVPIVALTGDMSPATLLKAEEAGFAAFLRKPADMDRLETVLRPLLEGKASA